MQLRTLLLPLLLASLTIGGAAAHPHLYAVGNDARVIVCEFTVASLCIGGVVLPAGEVVGGTVSVVDTVIAPVGFQICQDRNADGRCTLIEDVTTTHCGAATLTPDVDWVTSANLFVFVDGPVFGVPPLTGCDLNFAAGTAGTIDHN